MIINSDKISDLSIWGEKYFFLFDNKFIWAIQKNLNGTYFLTIYSGVTDLDILFQNIESFKSLTYRSVDYNTQEAIESFLDLFVLIQEKEMNVDDALDAIIDLS